MKVNLQMLVIRLTIMKRLTSICFWASSGLIEHCDSWINNFHPSFRFVQSLQFCVWVYARARILTPPALAKDLRAKIWHSATEKALLTESRTSWQRSKELWIPSPYGEDASFPVSPLSPAANIWEA